VSLDSDARFGSDQLRDPEEGDSDGEIGEIGEIALFGVPSSEMEQEQDSREGVNREGTLESSAGRLEPSLGHSFDARAYGELLNSSYKDMGMERDVSLSLSRDSHSLHHDSHDAAHSPSLAHRMRVDRFRDRLVSSLDSIGGMSGMSGTRDEEAQREAQKDLAVPYSDYAKMMGFRSSGSDAGQIEGGISMSQSRESDGSDRGRHRRKDWVVVKSSKSGSLDSML
jgi:hypothetical protein